MMSIGQLSLQEYFAGLYGHTDLDKRTNEWWSSNGRTFWYT
jgi:hypothetical protein